MKKLFIYIIGFLISTLVLSASTAYALHASPLRVEFNGYPGDYLNGQVVTQNTSNEPLTVMISKGDFIVTVDDHQVVFLNEEEESPTSLKDWITLEEEQVTVPPGEKALIPYQIKIPKDAESKGYYGTLFIQTVSPQAQGGFTGAKVGLRIAHLISLTVEGNTYCTLSLENLELSKANENLRFDATLHNKGNVHNAPTVKIEIIKDSGESVEMLDLNKDGYNVLPGAKKTYSYEYSLDNLDPGKYHAAYSVFHDGGSQQVGDVVFELDNEKELNVVDKKVDKTEIEVLKKSFEKSRTTIKSAIAVIVLISAAFALTCLCCCLIPMIWKKKKRKKQLKKAKK